jgi:hypothetical protein
MCIAGFMVILIVLILSLYITYTYAQNLARQIDLQIMIVMMLTV